MFILAVLFPVESLLVFFDDMILLEIFVIILVRIGFLDVDGVDEATKFDDDDEELVDDLFALILLNILY